MNEKTIADLQSNLGQVLVGTMQRISCLKGSYRCPASFGKYGSGFCGSGKLGKPLWIVTLAKHLYRTCQVNFTLLVYFLDTGVLLIIGAKDLNGFPALIIGVFLFNKHAGHNLTVVRVEQGNLLPFLDFSRLFF
ncbi:hypothetical protein ES703_78216 [subsurface metagenome]